MSRETSYEELDRSVQSVLCPVCKDSLIVSLPFVNPLSSEPVSKEEQKPTTKINIKQNRISQFASKATESKLFLQP